MKKIFLIMTFLYTSMVFSGAFSGSPKVLKFGVYTSDKPSVMYKKYALILSAASHYLSKQLGYPVKFKLQISDSYKQTVDQLAQGQIDFSRVGPASYIHAKKANPKIQIGAMELKKGKKIFYGIIFVRNDSKIREIKDLKGKRFAFGDERSTIGRYLSQRLLLLNGIPASSLSNYDYLKRHDRVCAAVLAGDFDAGAAKESTFNKYKNKGKGLRIITKFPNVTKPWLARANIDPAIFKQFQNFLLSLKDKKLLELYKVSGFTKSSDKEYNIIRKALELSKRF